MYSIIKNWYQHHFSNPQAGVLVLLLIVAFAVVGYLGDMLAPIIAAVIIAYLLESVVSWLVRLGLPRLLAVITVMIVTVGLSLTMLIGMVPLIFKQVSEVATSQVPSMIIESKLYLNRLPELYPDLFNQSQIEPIIGSIESQLSEVGKKIIGFSPSIAGNIFTFGLYSVIIPLLVFFLLKDKHLILNWFSRFFSENTRLFKQVWHEVDGKIGNYVRGKFIEIGIIGITSFVVFTFMELNYALLLSFLVGLSVVVPFVGAFAVTVPVVLIAFLQWGWSPEFAYLFMAYGIIQVLDGNVLVPVLFSGVVNLHPAAIIVSLTFFGGIWGLWGVFFAIPLATLVQAVLNAWPSVRAHQQHLERETAPNIEEII